MDEDNIPDDAKADQDRRVREYWSDKNRAQQLRDARTRRNGEQEAAEREFHRKTDDRLAEAIRPHIIDGEFQSDKYPTCPRGKVPLSVKDPTAQDLLWEYAQRRREVDAEFAADLEWALAQAGFTRTEGQTVESGDETRAIHFANWTYNTLPERTGNLGRQPDLQDLVYTAINHVEGDYGDADENAAEQVIERLVLAIKAILKQRQSQQASIRREALEEAAKAVFVMPLYEPIQPGYQSARRHGLHDAVKAIRSLIEPKGGEEG